MEAHAEDCILVPPDAEAAMPREPIVFEDEDHEGGEVSRPSPGQQVAGEAKQVEFTLTRRGRDFILASVSAWPIVARGGPKSCRLGRVTQVDQARAQVGVHRYLPEVSGVRIKWALAYLKGGWIDPPKGAVRPLRPFRSRRLSPRWTSTGTVF